ncbi:MAG: acyltransferase [Alphaproteobacteria bacterium]|nr:acyltransferase [Alphaproteobacteria bacterium]
MGYFRFLLASLVLASHAGVAPVFTGVAAVECFFVLSGFYIQLILREQYAHQAHWRRKFLESRLLRIFLPYWVVALAILLISSALHILTGQKPLFLFEMLRAHPWQAGTWAALFSDLFILGGEHLKLLRLAHGCEWPVWRALIIPPAWTLGIELIFYALAPFLLLCRARMLIAVTALCALGKYALLHGRAGAVFLIPCADGLLNGIVPLELGVFTAGALGYRFYARYLQPRPPLRHPFLAYAGAAAGVSLMMALTMKGLTLSPAAAMTAFYACACATALFAPLLFKISRAVRKDRRLGDLSYPFYLCHYYVLSLCQALPASRFVIFLAAEAATLLCAALLAKTVEIPLRRYRHRHFRSGG